MRIKSDYAPSGAPTSWTGALLRRSQLRIRQRYLSMRRSQPRGKALTDPTSLRKLVTIGLVTASRSKRMKCVSYTLTKAGVRATEEYAKLPNVGLKPIHPQ